MLGRLSNMRHARRPASSLLPRITKRQNYQGAPQRPILHQRMEAAARAGDMEAVRELLREHDLARGSSFGGSSHGADDEPGSASRSSPILYSIMAYFGLSAMASAYDYRVVSAEASAVAPDHGGSCMVKLHLKSWSFVGQLESTDTSGGKVKPPVRVAVLPHLSLTDVLYGARSRWCLVCTKRPGQTQWATMPDDNHGSGNMDGGGFSSTSASSTWEWSSSTGFSRGSSRAGGRDNRKSKGRDDDADAGSI